ncbi:zinc finger protein ZFP2-like isoform X2 [Plodia interpunctella]|uniref:zinc finger protein ZFP2-like isoform X2 n=1 Tax=Plodia interpunctella TaxID=58824 RepID=UPI002368AEFC|nr:zinc finger protein ZFP2-like isoform X2 [Plodia interpunctella]
MCTADVDMKKKWCEAVHKDMASFTRLYCCEDHFDLEQDTSNYMAYKIMNLQENKKTLLRLRKGVVPHIFACQEDTHCPSDKCFTKSESSQMDLEGSRSSSPSQEMSPNLVCRLCLAVEVRLFTITGSLQDVYEKLTDTALHSLDARPLAACYLCHAQLRKCRRLMLGSARAEALLTDMLRTSSKISLKAVSSIDRFANGLCSLNFSKAECLESVSPQFVTPEIKSETESDSEDRGADGPASDGRDPGPDGGEALSAPHQEEDIKQEPQLEEGPSQSAAAAGARDTDVYQEIPVSVSHLCDAVMDTTQQRRRWDDVVPAHTSGADKTKQAEGRTTDRTQRESQESDIRTIRTLHHCDVCQRQFNQSWDLKVHYRTHTGEKPFLCIVCQRAFKVRCHLSDHMRTHTGEKPFQCEVCEYRCNQKSVLIRHMRTHTGEKSYQCEVCQKAFRLKGHLSEHKRIHTGEKPFQCEVCQKAFCRKEMLSIHLRSHTNERPFQCEVCEKAFRLRSHLIDHTRIHTGEKPFQCEVCQYRCSQKSVLMRHMRTHTGEKSFQCEVCQRAFRLRSHLSDHVRIHTGEKPFQCEVCQKAFNRKEMLSIHLRSHTDERPFQCAVCQKAFRVRSHLSDHMKIHTGEKPFHCEVCQKAFSRKVSLCNHFRTHTGEKPFQCVECRYRCNRKSALLRHMRTHEKPV